MRFLVWLVLASLVTVSCSRHVERSKDVGAVAGNAYVETHPSPCSDSALLYADFNNVCALLGKPVNQKPLVQKLGKVSFYIGEVATYSDAEKTTEVLFIDSVSYSVTYTFAASQPELDLFALVTKNTGVVTWKPVKGSFVLWRSQSGFGKRILKDYKGVQVTAPELNGLHFSR